MRDRLSQINENNFDDFLEEYTSKLEQKFVAQTQQLKTITDNAASALFMIDLSGKPIFMNPAARKTLGYSLNDIKGKELHKILHPEESKAEREKCTLVNAILNMENVSYSEGEFTKEDGSLFPVSFSIAPLREGGLPQGSLLEFQDITKRKELERQKDDFIGVASHELKTPVTSIKAYTQILEQRFKKAGDSSSADLVGKMDAQLNRLTNLIADLLDVTKLQGERLRFHNVYFGMNKLAKEVAEDIQRTTTKHDIKLKLGNERTVYVDRDRTGQVITNFLTNAIKYSPTNKKITVSTKVRENNVELCVRDFGVGISKTKQKKVFERFYRISGSKEDTYPGLGLGLYISSEIIERQGGKIWVESQLKKGSKFCFSIPLPSSNRKRKKKIGR